MLTVVLKTGNCEKKSTDTARPAKAYHSFVNRAGPRGARTSLE